MKKFLSKAILPILSGLMVSAAASAELPTDPSQRYYVKIVGADLYLNIETSGSNAKISSTPSFIFFKAGESDNAKYAISNGANATGNFIIQSTYNASVSATASYIWDIQEQSTAENGNTIVKFDQKAATKLAQQGKIGCSKPTEGALLYCNANGTTDHNSWELIPINGTIHTITYTYSYGEHTATKTANVIDGSDAADAIPAMPFFTASGLKETNTTVSESNRTFNVEGTWSLPFTPGQVYRADLRKSNAEGCTNWKVEGANIKTRQGNNADEFEPERLFYFNTTGLSPLGIKGTLHSIAADADKGVQANNSNNAICSFSSSPTEFVVVSNSTGNDGFSLAHIDSDNGAHLNDINGTLAIWAQGTKSQNNIGSFVRFKPLTDSDFANTTWHYCGGDQPFDTDALNTAKAAPTAENLRALFTPNDYRSIAEARYRELTGFDYNAEYKCLIPGWKPYSEFDALLQVLNNSDATQQQLIEAIGTQTTALSYDPSNAATYACNITPGAIYTIRSTEYGARGALKVADGVLTATPNDGSFDATSPDYQFTFVEADGKYYLYSIGGQEFLYAFGEKSNSIYNPIKNYTDHTWTLDSHASEIELDGNTTNTPHAVFVKGGAQPSSPNSHMTNYDGKGGLTIIDNSERRIIVAVGIADATDGNGLLFNYAGKFAGSLPTPAHDEVAGLVASIPADEDAAEVVNHLPSTALIDINAAVDPSHQWHLLNNTERTAINTSKVYTLQTSGGKAIGVIDGKQQEADYKKGDAAFNWSVREVTPSQPEDAQAEGDTTYEFAHTHNGKEVLLTLNGSTQHTPDYSTIGQVGLGDRQFVIASSTGSAETTAITEIGINHNSTIYDLQGRRVAKPTRGINIVNGKKTLVK